MGHPHEANDSDVELITFGVGDPEDPVNWPKLKKYAIVVNICILSFTSVFGSSAYAPGQQHLMQKYHINIEAASSGLSLYVLGFAMGPLIWGPFSELRGRRLSYMIAWPLMIVSTAPSAFVDNIIVILLFRFFTGCFAACALNNVVSDMFHNDPQAQSQALAWVSFCPLSGPCIGSLVGFFIAAAGWRGLWVVRVHFFLSIVCWPLVFALKETHGPTILKKRARALRAEGRVNIRTHEELEPVTREYIIQNYALRPAKMLMHEPIVLGAALWISLAYGIIYFFFEVYPVVFITQHNIPFRLCGLMFLPIILGMFLIAGPYQYLTRLFARMPLPWIVPEGTELAPPELRLKLVLTACIGIPISLFWFGWTSGRETHWIAPALAGVLFGYSMLAIFMCFIAYVTLIYKIYSASSSAANTCIRSIIAAAFPVATHRLLDALGTKWGLSLFGFLSLGLIPIPLIFIRYGGKLRARSRYAREAEAVVARLNARRDEEKTDVEVSEAPRAQKEKEAFGV
ncbi:MFS general substrate transporter [Gloeopeniophorella convolvens]|nr:MFS general substrate transporter [Gloeopeniophorella convolvens]